MADTENATAGADSGSPNPFAGKSLDDLITPPPAASEKLSTELHAKADRDSAILAQTEKAADTHEVEMEKWHAATAANLNDIQKWDEKAERQKYAYEPIEAFGSFASVFAIAASMFTKTPMENALNGAAAAMNAVKASKEDAFKHSYQAWKDNNELAIKRGQMMHEAYQEALELMKTDYTRGTEKLKNSAIRYGDQQAIVLTENGMNKELWEAVSARANAISGMAKAHEEMVKDEGIAFRIHALKSDPNFINGTPEEKLQIYDRYFAVKESAEETAVRNLLIKNPKLSGDELVNKLADIHRKMNTSSWQAEALQRYLDKNPDATPEQLAEFGQKLATHYTYGGAGSTLPPETLRGMADRFLAGDDSVLHAFSIRDPNRVALQQMIGVVAKERNLSPEQIARAKARAAGLASEERALGTQAGRAEGLASQAFLSGDLAIQTSEKVPRGSFVPITQLQYMAQRAGSNSPLAKLDAATTTFVNEYVRAVAGTGVPTDAARQHAYEILNQAYSHETYKSVVNLLKQEMQRAVAAPNQVRKMLSEGKSVSEVLGGELLEGESKPAAATYTSKDGTVWEWIGADPPTAATRKNQKNWQIKSRPASNEAPG